MKVGRGAGAETRHRRWHLPAVPKQQPSSPTHRHIHRPLHSRAPRVHPPPPPPSTLLHAQRTNHHWRAVILTSPALLRALFLSPVPRGPLEPLGPPGENKGRDRPELREREPPVLNGMVARYWQLGPLQGPDAECDGGFLALVTFRRNEGEGEVGVGVEVNAEGEGGSRAGAGAGAGDESLVEPVAVQPSWRAMFVTQPPARRVEVQVNGKGVPHDCAAWVEDGEGLRMGRLFDVLEEVRRGFSGKTLRGKE